MQEIKKYFEQPDGTIKVHTIRTTDRIDCAIPMGNLQSDDLVSIGNTTYIIQYGKVNF
jgi:hypothetical protein